MIYHIRRCIFSSAQYHCVYLFQNQNLLTKLKQLLNTIDLSLIFFYISILYFSSPNMAKHSFIKGSSGKGLLLYLHDEKNLFIKKFDRNHSHYYECYHVLQRNQLDYKPCPVNCVVKEGECRRNESTHSHPTNHKILYRDMQSVNAMKETCHWLRTHCPSSAHKIPLYDIFMLEISKWVYITVFFF